MSFKVGSYCLIDFHNNSPHLGRKVASVEKVHIDEKVKIKTVNFNVRDNLFNVWYHVVDKEALREVSPSYPYKAAYDFFLVHCDEKDLLWSRADVAKYLISNYKDKFEDVVLALASAAYEIN